MKKSNRTLVSGFLVYLFFDFVPVCELSLLMFCSRCIAMRFLPPCANLSLSLSLFECACVFTSVYVRVSLSVPEVGDLPSFVCFHASDYCAIKSLGGSDVLVVVIESRS